jgi:hypothetical protein
VHLAGITIEIPYPGIIFKAIRPPNYRYSMQYSKYHFSTEFALLNSEQQVTKHYITMTSGTTINSNKHVVMIYTCTTDTLTINYLFIHE